MAHIVPSIAFIQDFKKQIHNGNSVNKTIDSLCRSKEKDVFTLNITRWWLYYNAGKSNRIVMKTDYEKMLVQVLKRGVEGAPIYEHLQLLETEMIQEFDRQWKAYLESMPFKLLAPLLLFFFPSYVILLFGPLFIQFLSEVAP